MISYEEYENKIKKLAKFKSFLYKFKFLFIGIFALIIALIATLLGLKGMLSGAIQISSSVYGESYEDPTGVSGFMSSVSYEYAVSGTDKWSNVKPVLAGKYEVRAVSSKIAGKQYGKVTQFEIEPRKVEFSIVSDQVEYGGIPQEISYKLLDGDRLDESALCFLYDDYAATTTGVDLDASSVKVLHGSEDRTSCYAVAHDKKELSITKRNINITLARQDYIYSGAPVLYRSDASPMTIERLANGDVIEIDAAKLEFTQGGMTVDYVLSADTYGVCVNSSYYEIYKIVDGNRIRVTAQYEGTCLTIAFTVSRREITVKTPSDSKEFNGEYLEKKDGYTVTGLLGNDEFHVFSSTRVRDVHWNGEEVAGVDNEFTSYSVTTQDGATNLTENYRVNWEYGKLTITPRAIEITSPSDSSTYDGLAHSIPEVSCTDALFNAVADPMPLTVITTVQKVSNRVRYTIVNRATSSPENVANFTISENWGELEIVRRSITVCIDDAQKVYDAEDLTTPVSGGKISVKLETPLATGDFLADGNLFSITDAQVNVTNTSTYKVMCSSGDRTDNYIITYERGTLTISPRPIKIITASANPIFSGTPFSDDSYMDFCTLGGEGLLRGDRLITRNAPQFTNVHDTDDSEENNRCEYDLPNGNYTIAEIEYGEIVIQPRPIVVRTASASYVYDGQEHSDYSYTAHYLYDEDEAGLCNDDRLTFITASLVTVQNVWDSAEYNNRCMYTAPASENYQIARYEYGTLTVTPRLLTVTTADDSFLYDGNEHSHTGDYVAVYIDEDNREEAGLIGSDVLTVKDGSVATVQNAWDTALANNTTLYDVPSDNYEIVKYNFGALTVRRRVITVELYQLTTVTYGIYLEYPDAMNNIEAISGDGLAYGQQIRVQIQFDKPEQKRAGVYTYGQNGFLFYDAEGELIENGHNNYTITCEEKQAEILKKRVTIKLFDMTVIYGDEIVYPNLGEASNYEVTGSDELAYHEELTILSVDFLIASQMQGKRALPVGYYFEAVSLAEGDESVAIDGEFDLSNYILTFRKADLTVNQRVLTIYMSSAKTYYGEEITREVTPDSVYPYGLNNVEAVYKQGSSYEVNGLLEGDDCEIKKVTFVRTDIFQVAPGTSVPESNFYTEPTDQGLYYIKPYEIWIYPADWGGDESRVEKSYDEPTGDTPNANYLVQYYIPGELTVLPRPVSVKLNAVATTPYDGTEHLYTAGSETNTLAKNRAEFPELLKKTDGILPGEVLKVVVCYSGERMRDGKPVYTGSYQYYYDSDNSYIEGSATGIENYVIYSDVETMQISKRAISVTMNPLSLLYGEAVRYPDDNNVTAETIAQLIDADRILIAHRDIIFEFDGDHPNKGTYRIFGSNAQFSNDEAGDITDCYEPEYLAGELTVSKLAVTVKLEKKSVVYGDAIGVFAATIETQPYGSDGKTTLPYSERLTFTYVYRVNGTQDFDPAFVPKNVIEDLYDVKFSPVLSVGQEGLNNYTISYFDSEDNPLTDIILPKGLEITKYHLEVRITHDDVYYGTVDFGSNKVEYASPLPYEEVLTASTHYSREGIELVPKFAGTYDIIKDAFYIDGNAEGVNNYEINLIQADCTLRILPLSITVTLNGLTVVYGDEVKYASGNDGTDYTTNIPIAFDDILRIYPDFACGDRPQVNTLGYDIVEKSALRTLTDKTGTASVTDEHGFTYTVADSYSIRVNKGLLIITKRSISIVLNTISEDPIYYDGEAHNYVPGGEISEGEMAYDEELVVAVKYSYSYDETGSKYSVDKIGKAGFYTYNYDATNTTVKNGGSQGLGNYTVTVTNVGSLRIMPCAISITIKSLPDQIYGTGVEYPTSAGNYVKPVIGGFVEDEELTINVIFRNRLTSKTYENGWSLPNGDYDIIESGVHPKVMGGEFADHLNYEYSYIAGTVKVDKREIQITLNDITEEYGDAFAYEIDSGNYKSLSVTLHGNETLTVTEVEFYDSVKSRSFTDLSYQPVVGQYEIRFVSARVEIDGEDVTDNYIFTSVNGEFKVTKRRIIFETASHTFVYNAQDQSDDGYTLTNMDEDKPALVFGAESFVAGDVVTVCNVGDNYDNEFDIIIKIGDVEVTDYYDFEDRTIYGRLSVVPLVLYVESSTQSKVYDGTPLQSDKTVASCIYYTDNDEENGTKHEGLLSGHRFEFEVIEVTEANSYGPEDRMGGVDNDCVKDILDEHNNSVKDNYERRYKTGKLIIYSRIIEVYATDASKVYDGTALTSPDDHYDLIYYPDNDRTKTPLYGSDMLVGTHVLCQKPVSVVNVLGTYPDYRKYPNNKYFIKESNDEEARGVSGVYGSGVCNYLFKQIEGFLEIRPRPVTIDIGDIEMTYTNGQPSVLPDITIEPQNLTENRGLIDRDKNEGLLDFEFTYGVEFLNGQPLFHVGEYLIKATPFRSSAYSGASDLNNYEFQFNCGRLRIKPAKLILSPDSAEGQYTDINQTPISISSSIVFGSSTHLMSGDEITSVSFTRSLDLSPKEGMPIVYVGILNLNIRNNDVYDLKYDEEGNVLCDEFGDPIKYYRSMNFNYNITLLPSTMQYSTRTLYIVQHVPDDYKSINYTGTMTTIPGGNELFDVLNPTDVDTLEERNQWIGIGDEYSAATYGLAPGDVYSFGSAYVNMKVMIYDKWVYLDIRNGSYDVTRLYNIIPVSPRGGEITSIEVKALPLKITFKDSLTSSKLSEIAAKRIPLLPADYYDMLGLNAVEEFAGLEEVEIFVFEDSGTYRLQAYIFRRMYVGEGGLRHFDRTNKYAVTFEGLIASATALVKTIDDYPKVYVTFTADFNGALLGSNFNASVGGFVIPDSYIKPLPYTEEGVKVSCVVTSYATNRYLIYVCIYKGTGGSTINLAGQYEVALRFEGSFETEPVLMISGSVMDDSYSPLPVS